MTALPAMVVVVPIEPSSTGNGLAMRVDLMVEAACRHHAVELVVIPVAGRAPVTRARVAVAGGHDIEPSSTADHHSLLGWLASQLWRDRLDAVAPLPRAVARVPLDTADALVERLEPKVPRAVLACRLSTAVFGLRLAEAFDVPLIVDADDDDEALARVLDGPEISSSWGRIADLVLPRATHVFAASREVADALTARHRMERPVLVAPNPAPVPSAPVGAPPGAGRLLMIANFSYRPNVDGARWFLDQILPLLSDRWTCHLVGIGSSRLLDGSSSRATAHELVDDVTPLYEQIDVVVAPLLAGSGTRVKVLEAFTHRRPVVATTRAVDGLGVVDEVHAILRDDPEGFAAAIERCADSAHTAHLVETSAAFASDTYDRDDIVGEVAGHLRLAAAPERNRVDRQDYGWPS